MLLYQCAPPPPPPLCPSTDLSHHYVVVTSSLFAQLCFGAAKACFLPLLPFAYNNLRDFEALEGICVPVSYLRTTELNDDGPSLSLTRSLNCLRQHTTEVKTAQRGLRMGYKDTSKDTRNGPVSFLEKVRYHFWPHFLTIFDLFLVDTHRPKSPKVRLNGHPVGKNHS